MQLNLFFPLLIYKIFCLVNVGGKKEPNASKNTFSLRNAKSGGSHSLSVADISSQPGLNELDKIVGDTVQLLMPLSESQLLSALAPVDNDVSL